ncbi:MAG: 30S ribosomal protein S16 [Candidatus Omnitrophica bacterium]|nr:30S ribosomal protein S16 [Candidatus Omnitrophota bacterium]
MSVVIRLKRLGTKRIPHSRIVVADRRFPRDGRIIEEIGYYDPSKNPPLVNVKQDRAEYWLSVGAQPSETVASIFKKLAIRKPIQA